MTVELLPSSLLTSPKRARARVAAIAGAAAAACALAGCWMRFEDGLALRGSLGATSAVFGALVLVVALGAQSAAGAVARALAVSTVLGFVSIVIPSALLSSDKPPTFVAFLIFGTFFGSVVGLVYGIFLAALAGLTWCDVHSWTHEGADRATRNAALWALVPIGIALGTALHYDTRAPSEWASEATLAAHAIALPLGLAGSSIALAVAAGSFVVAQGRLSRRRRWLERVLSGEDPRWSVRVPGPHDDLASVPRLRAGGHVLEHREENGAYRVAATGRAVAIL